MEIDKTLLLPASPERVWALLLDPQAMAKCVPGMQSVQVVSPDEYTAEMVTKVSFITARMKLRTRIVERDEPHYLKAEGTGEDSSVASSMKQTTEMHLEALQDGQSQLRLKVKVDVVGRLATFGLSALKTKADRLWDEFGQNLVQHLGGGTDLPPTTAVPTPTVAAPVPTAATPSGALASVAVQTSAAPVPTVSTVSSNTAPPNPLPSLKQGNPTARRSWWERLFGPEPANMIVVDWLRPDGSRLQVQWPADQAQACLTWLNQFKPS